jgi:hypothetical protein
MPTLHEYVDREGFYVKHSFASRGRLYHVVYQVSEAAASIFNNKSIRDGAEIPKGLFRELRNDGHLFTQKSGTDGERIEFETKKNDDEDAFAGLTEEARWWITFLVTNHPETVIRKFDVDSKEVHLENIPENYMKQLATVARIVDGTDFFANLKLSYEEMIKTKGIITNHGLGKAGQPKACVTHETKNGVPKFNFTQKKPTVPEAKARLISLGLKGNRLSKTIRAIMKEETTMASVEHDLYLEQLQTSGFSPIPLSIISTAQP